MKTDRKSAILTCLPLAGARLANSDRFGDRKGIAIEAFWDNDEKLDAPEEEPPTAEN